MKMIAVVDNQGNVINIGAWKKELEIVDIETNTIQLVDNPLPEGAVEGEFDIQLTANGKYVVATDYRSLRAAEYPAIADQLDALYKAGVFPQDMAIKIQEIKLKYPKR